MESCIIELTEATHKYGNLNIRPCGKDFFPPDVFGGSSKKVKLGTPITLRVEGLQEPIMTDIPTDKKTKNPRWMFRERAWAKKFVILHNLKVGDTIVVSRIAPRKYLINPNGRKATRQKYLITPTEGSSDLVNLQQAELTAYTISLDAIKEKVSNGRKRKRPTSSQLTFGSEAQNNAKKIVNEFNEKIVRIDGDIPVRLPIKKRDRFLFISYDQSAYTHGFHKYPAKFFPELPRWLIKRFSKENDLILDPFSGSGTVNIEALLISRHSVGIDVDPFSRFVSNVKTTPLPIDELEKSQEALLNKVMKFDFSKVEERDIPQFPYRDNWFNREIILELAYIKKIINSLKVNEKIRNYFLINMSSIIRAVSNADDNCTRTVIRKKLNKKVFPSNALTKFVKRILINTPKMKQFSELAPKNIRTEFPDTLDARNIDFPSQTFDLAVTSPPYVNAVDYPRTHQLESYWLDLASGSLTPLKKKHVGTESVLSKEYQFLHQIGVKQADRIIEEIYSVDKRRAYIAYKYLQDMKKNFEETYRVLKKGARYAVVVGNNRIRGSLFENWKYLMKIAEQVGFTIDTYFGSEIIKHFIKVPRKERINTDWIVILKK